MLVPPPLTFDASIREVHSARYAVSQFPLETGAIVTDHVQKLPDQLQIDALLTDHPGRLVLPERGRHRNMWQQLVAFADLRQPGDMQTSFRIYTSMVIESMSAPRSVDQGRSVIVSMVMRKLEIAVVDQAQVLADAALAFALGEQDLGQVLPDVDAALAL